jgi:acyl carrier protein
MKDLQDRVCESPLPDEASLTDDIELLGSELQLDSLDLATIVVQLQEPTGFDPFADEFIEFRTIGELVALFEARESKPAA